MSIFIGIPQMNVGDIVGIDQPPLGTNLQIPREQGVRGDEKPADVVLVDDRLPPRFHWGILETERHVSLPSKKRDREQCGQRPYESPCVFLNSGDSVGPLSQERENCTVRLALDEFRLPRQNRNQDDRKEEDVPCRIEGHVEEEQGKEEFDRIEWFFRDGEHRDRQEEKIFERHRMVKIGGKPFRDIVHDVPVRNQFEREKQDTITVWVDQRSDEACEDRETERPDLLSIRRFFLVSCTPKFPEISPEIDTGQNETRQEPPVQVYPQDHDRGKKE